MSLHQAARLTHYHVSYLSKVVNGRKPGSPDLAEALDKALAADGALAAMVPGRPATIVAGDDETDAWELARLATASDVGTATVDRIERAVDDLAVDYHVTAPARLLGRIRVHLAYIARLLDARKTLADHRRLLVAGGWLSLLAATCAIDLCSWDAAAARLRTAAELARESGHAELAAWCLETRAWQLLTVGDYQAAARVCRQARRTGPPGGSARIQATAQQARACARLAAGGRSESYDALRR